jgi:hypothetical protein
VTLIGYEPRFDRDFGALWINPEITIKEKITTDDDTFAGKGAGDFVETLLSHNILSGLAIHQDCVNNCHKPGIVIR